MNKKEYIIKQLSRTNKKNYENYVVCRIINKLDDLSIKFITQQPIYRQDGKKALVDLYFPQFNICVEVDEGYHKKHLDEDIARDADIIAITKNEVLHIDITPDIKIIHKEIDRIVRRIKYKKEGTENFEPWNMKKEYNTDTYIQRGFIRLEDNVAFRKIVDACNCFGHNYKGYQKAWAKHPLEQDKGLWFPKLYKNDKWDNQLSSNGEVITEKKVLGNEEMSKQLNPSRTNYKRIVFARVKDLMGTLYRFKGVFKCDVEKSIKNGVLTYLRIGTEVKTYNKNGLSK